MFLLEDSNIIIDGKNSDVDKTKTKIKNKSLASCLLWTTKMDKLFKIKQLNQNS